jgi:hypothetical protein
MVLRVWFGEPSIGAGLTNDQYQSRHYFFLVVKVVKRQTPPSAETPIAIVKVQSTEGRRQPQLLLRLLLLSPVLVVAWMGRRRGSGHDERIEEEA